MLVTVVTGSRSEWGVLEPLVREMGRHPDMDVTLLVCGSHLSPEFGYL